MRRYWRLKALLEYFLMADRTWGYIRLVSVLLVTALFIMSGQLIFSRGSSTIGVSLFSGQGLRFFVIPVAALFGALLVGGYYVQDIYELRSFGQAFRYLVATLFAVGYPRFTISGGERKIEEGETNLLNAIGGPGYVQILPGNVILLERLTSPSNVCAAGSHFISRLETIKEIVSLDDQHGFIEAVSATTKDGIEIVIRNVHFRYRLRTGRRLGNYAERTPVEPYPFSMQAVRNMAYNRTVDKNGLEPWHAVVRSVVNGVITSYINQNQIDHLTAPDRDDIDPRLELSKKLRSRGVRERLRNVGAELLWFDIGHFDIVDEKVAEQRLDTWQAKWIGNANVIRAYGEAKREAYQELGRAEAQAEMLMSIIHVFDDVGLSEDSAQNLQNIVLVRTAQILEATSKRSQNPTEQS